MKRTLALSSDLFQLVDLSKNQKGGTPGYTNVNLVKHLPWADNPMHILETNYDAFHASSPLK